MAEDAFSLNIIFNSMTAESLKKFLKISGDEDIKKNSHKRTLISDIKEKMNADSEFNNEFKKYFKEIEKAGRKDFWFTRVPQKFEGALLNDLRNRLKKFEKEDGTIYMPQTEGSAKYFNVSSNNNIVEIKAVRRKSIRELDTTKNRTEGDYLYVAYRVTEIRHVSYYKLDLSSDLLLIGVDVWQNLSTKEKLAEVSSDIDHIFGRDFYDSLIFADIKAGAKTLLRNSDNVITKELKEAIGTKNQSATFAIDNEKINVIKKALNDGEVTLDQIKDKYIEDDVRNNEVFQAAETKSIDLIVKAGKGCFFYYSDLTQEYDYFRFETHAGESRIKFLNDHITLEGLNHVLSKII